MVIWTVGEFQSRRTLIFPVAGLSFTAMLFSIPPLFCTDVAFGEPRAAQVIHRAVMVRILPKRNSPSGATQWRRREALTIAGIGLHTLLHGLDHHCRRLEHRRSSDDH